MKNRNFLTLLIGLMILLFGIAACSSPVVSERQATGSYAPSPNPSAAVSPAQSNSQIEQPTQPVSHGPPVSSNPLPPPPPLPTAGPNSPFPGTMILGKPTADSIALSLLASINIEIYVQYGTAPGKYTTQTAVTRLLKDQPLELPIKGLNMGTQYYYRVCHQTTGENGFSAAPESTFHTQRAAGDSFAFTLDADPHWDNNVDPQKLGLTFQNILNENPDFNIDLGDTFMTEKLKARSYTEAAGVYVDKRTDFTIFGRSVPLFLTVGNHDGEIGGAVNKNENYITNWARKARVTYYPNPISDSFYTGNTKEDPYIGLGENYYAWEWGDALFVVLDPYWYSPGGGKNISGWNMTLGKEQYDWLKSTLENSKVKYKFVFSHSLAGGFDLGTAGNMRGGIEAAGLYEWGGENADGSWGFDANRPGWGEPIHQLMVDNQVTAFFHGHDHFFGKQELDGIIYQECPQPGSINERNHASEFGYQTGTFMDGAGHVRVTVAEDQVTVDFIRTYLPGKEPAGHQNGEVAYSYTVAANR